jgi:hypothetical protein
MSGVPAPESFREIVATALSAIAVLYSIGSIWAGHTAVRMFAIVLVVSISLFANSPVTYFAAVFVVATAVTELGFLEHLAAILRGSKEYFDYQKSVLSLQESKDKAALELAEPPALIEHEAPLRVLPSGAASEAGYAIEQLALTYLERRLGMPPERSVRFSREGVTVEFDGVIQRTGGRPDILIEVKLVASKRFGDVAISAARQALAHQRSFEEITGRRSTLRLVVVVPDSSAIADAVAPVLEQIRAMSHTLQLDVVDFDAIGYVPPGRAA